MTKRRSKDMKGDARDLVWWWDQPPSINDESWAQLLALANPKLSPDCAAAKDARRRAELAVQVLLRGQQVLLRGQQETFNLAEKAEDGISFLVKLEAVTFWTQAFFPEKEMELDALKETVRDITILIDFVHVWCHLLLTGPKQNPRTKSNQHLAVSIISKVWHDLVVAELRLKKNFVEFAYLCLATARAGVTRNSIVESWDRHVLPDLIEEETTEEEAGT